MKKKFPALIWCTVLLVVGIAGYAYYRYQSLHPSTNDAYLDANVVHISTQVTGPIKQILVKNHEHVEKHQPLATIDPAPFLIAVQRAKATLKLAHQSVGVNRAAIKASEALVKERQAELINAKKDQARILPLVKMGRIAPTKGDEVIRKARVAKAALVAAINELHEAREKLGDPNTDGNAELMKARSDLAQAKLDLAHTHITAPASGYIDNFKLRVGTLVDPQDPLFVLIEDGLWWVNANYKETQLKALKPKQRARIVLDLYPDHRFHGYVQSISHGSGSAFSLLPPENATGNWVKVTQRFPVKIILTDPSPDFPLRVGASGTVTIDTLSSVAKHAMSASAHNVTTHSVVKTAPVPHAK